MKSLKTGCALIIFLNAFTLILAGCGSSSDKDDDNPPQTGTTVISGVASKGLIKGGNVRAYALNADGSTGAQLGTAVTDQEGYYSINLGSYAGNVLVETTGGVYTDEASGDANVPAPPLRAALTNAQGNVSIAITPLTDIAVQCAGSALTGDKIEGANYLVGAAFGIQDIIGTRPHDATRVPQLGAPDGGIRYGLLLASLSQMAQTEGKNVGEVISDIRTDLLDQKPDVEGPKLLNAFTTFAASNQNRTQIRAVPLLIANAISDAIENPITPPNWEPDPAAAGLIKAKRLVADLRNTALSLYNYQTGEVKDVVKTPFVNLAQELESGLGPNLAFNTQRIGWIVDCTKLIIQDITTDEPLAAERKLDPEPTYTYTQGDLKLELTLVECDNNVGYCSVTFTVTDTGQEPDAVLDSGALTLTANSAGKIVVGVFTGFMTTLSNEKLVVNLNYSGIYQDTLLARIILTGSIIIPGGFTFDFANDGRKLEVNFASTPEGKYIPLPDVPVPSEDEWNAWTEEYLQENPEMENALPPYPDTASIPDKVFASFYPTRLFFSGRAKSNTAQMDGNIIISDMTWYEAESDDQSVVAVVPQSVRFEGTFQELKNNASTGAKFAGSIVGTWQNADTFNCCIPQSPTNYPEWTATFDGTVAIPSQPVLTAFLSVEQTGYRLAEVEVSYRKTYSNGTVISLEGTATINDQTKQLTATLSNQENMQVTICYDDTKPKNSKLSGSITTANGTKMADLYTISGMPTVKYTADDYIESVF
ncbi:MAG: hypothetical protein AB1611_08330 [bacterium]